MASGPTALVTWLRATGEVSRIRLLSLCSRRDFSVSDLARALGQSEPRVSRHLRILCEAGLLERLRQGQWVHYRLATQAAAAGFIQGVLAQLDRSDAQLSRDLERAQAPHASRETARPRDGSAASESRLGQALQGFVDANMPSSQQGSALLVGVEHLEVLESAASMAADCVAIAHSRRAAQGARAFAERRGLNCRVLLASAARGLNDRDIGGRTFDGVILDHPAAVDADFADLLASARNLLSATGKLCLFERYESLQISRERVVEHPLARLRRLLADSGLTCERLSPLEADGEHVLAAVAVPAAHAGLTNLRRA
ncbi:MAG TPA: metalloregulator ArsR/SmtB family transcription factor [Steroidobacteraceae bacterium]|nr:metalloregulator ArsR/SmtB family transcription factor [Steroidobacteraceae bacterium]